MLEADKSRYKITANFLNGGQPKTKKKTHLCRFEILFFAIFQFTINTNFFNIYYFARKFVFWWDEAPTQL